MTPPTRSNPDWLDAGPADALPMGASTTVQHKALTIAVFHLAHGWYAIKNDCPHAGEALCRGAVHNGVVTCPGHNWQFRLDTGACLRGNTEWSLRTFPVEVRDDRIWIQV